MNKDLNKYGYFDNTQYEYVITSPFTPSPWINYLGNDGFHGLISNTAGGYTFYRDPKFRRLTRYRYNNVPVDTGGRYFYLTNNDKAWSLTGRPMDTALDEYECRHGMGYSKISSSFQNIKASATYFVPLNTTAEVCILSLKNTSDSEQSIGLFSFLEWCLWNAEDDAANFQRNLSTGEVEVDGSTLYHKTEFRERRNHYAFYHVNTEIQGFDTCRDNFLGPYKGMHNPRAVLERKSNNSKARGFSPIASHHIELNLAPNEEIELVFVMGYCELDEAQKWESKGVINKGPAKAMIAQFDTVEKAKQKLLELNQYWRTLLNKCLVKTPDEAFDTSINIWNQYQNMVTFNLSRSASFYESGIGRGMGFRDSNQDTIGFTHMVPAKVRERILDLSATQKPDGSAFHQYQPLTKKGNANIGGNFNDDPMWLVLSTVNYIKETGDFTILDEQVPYDNDMSNMASHFDHLQRAFDHVVNNLGPHGLPLIGRADWNDCLNLNCFSTDPNESFQTTQRGKSDVAESVMIAGQFVLYGRDFAELCKVTGRQELADACLQHVEKMVETIKTHAWDGEWFLRAYDANGEKIGSNENEEGKIFIESQGFCVMAEVGVDDGKAQQAMDSVEKMLATDYGIMLQQPAFSEYNKYLGEISSYPPGYKENAGIFCHNNPWILISDAMLGNSDRCYDYFSRLCPSYLQDTQDLRRSEPYVYSQMVAGKDAEFPGQAKNSWLTGTAAWCYYAAVQYILGIRPDYHGLVIAPSIPSSWDKVEVHREYRDATYDIEIVRRTTGKINNIVVEVDGVKMKDNLIPYDLFHNHHSVRVTLLD
ncbi:GH36-type glycosyl hydrolase domain-containing protein [Glaciecola sp. 1036]|uniref:GH36-type glycosyl hydrolase domain-containing protein n=1 Tax=Alteromonadaceae TaxID=72275 RepID=UPI003CFEC260